jgi:hypothetical protein
MHTTIPLDPLSLSCVHIELYRDDHSSGKSVISGPASGFIIKRGDNHFCITNWHVATGKNAITLQPLCKKGSLPTFMRIHMIKSINGLKIEWVGYDISLEKQNWIEHPRGREIDVVAFPLPNDKNYHYYPLDLGLQNTDVICQPAMPVSIIGYPCGLTGGGKLPIWLTGYVATEPFVDIDGKPLLYANVTGCQGLSGAPVVMRTSGNYINGKGEHIWSTDLLTKFLGIYSGRAHEDSNVCRVWKATVIDELNRPEPRLL